MLTRVGVPVDVEAEPSAPDPQPATLICFSHLRWNFVFQRPQHLMSRFAREMNVIYWEEPVDDRPERDRLPPGPRGRGLAAASASSFRIFPQACPRMRAKPRCSACSTRISRRIRGPLIAWYYTPMMLPFSRHLDADLHRVRRDGRAVEVQVRAGQAARARAGADRPGRHRLHRRIEPLRGEEGPPRQRPLLPVVGRPRAFRARRARASSTRPTRKTCRGRASASTA